MNVFADKVAIVTGGASGIGRAIGEQLASHGARVVLADRNAEGAAQVAGGLVSAGHRASAATVDVIDASAVQALVQATAAAHGRLDYLFNNAGVAVAGEVRDMALADWDRLIDVNVRGVVHGVVAAYPLMIQQGFGHIVNTASAAGLGPTPGFTAYATTKHAVVGLSTSLRGEAARRGVRVSVVCPGFIDTPLLTTSPLLNIDREAALKFMKFRLTSVEECARALLRGVSRNRGIIVITPVARMGWVLYRYAPRLTLRALAWFADYSPVLPPR
jgi:NAD(P)-dependent dehydrogenase (short-subunit alcohol dehydrogenase family)